jgi:coenzyme F420-reducing hydrogenase beta subunit
MSCTNRDIAPAQPRALAPADIVRAGLCIGCGVCAAQAARADVRMQFDRYGQFKPAGPKDWLQRPREEIAASCPFSPFARDESQIAAQRFPTARYSDFRTGRLEAAYVGHAQEGDFRAEGSSGGMVTWVAAELLRRGLVDGVAHVRARDHGTDGHLFGYTISRSPEALRTGAKSRYYPVELSEVLSTVRSVPGRYAVVGIPCFVKAVRLSCLYDPVLDERIVYTLGLFCGHMKSARMAESFTWQMEADIRDAAQFDYRVKNPDRPANWYTAQMTFPDGSTRSKDWWHLADGDWGAGFFQNSACNFCDDVVAETADISFGDAWVEPYSADGRGTNVVVVRSPELRDILQAGMDAGRLALRGVDSEFIAGTQAAGLRQRREGLAFRLAWPRLGLRPRKRVAPRLNGLPARRMVIYVMRHQISAWSHRMFWLARRLRWPALYIGWAGTVLALYQGIAYSRGMVGRIADKLGIGAVERRD